MRSSYKGPYIEDIDTAIAPRNVTISKKDIGKIFFISTGNSFHKLIVREEMLGHKFGEFALTTHIGSSIHLTKKNLKKKKRKK